MIDCPGRYFAIDFCMTSTTTISTNFILASSYNIYFFNDKLFSQLLTLDSCVNVIYYTLSRSGVSIPPFFFISSSCFCKFFNSAELLSSARTFDREPKSFIGLINLGYSIGSYSKSASWIITISPLTCFIPVLIQAPLPIFYSQ